jgi:hypothetical protein
MQDKEADVTWDSGRNVREWLHQLTALNTQRLHRHRSPGSVVHFVGGHNSRAKVEGDLPLAKANNIHFSPHDHFTDTSSDF